MPRRKKTQDPTQYVDNAKVDFVEHYAGAAANQEKAKKYLADALSSVESSADMTAKSSKKAKRSFVEAAESQQDIAKAIETGMRGAQKVKRQSSNVSAMFKDLFSDATDQLGQTFSHTASYIRKIKKEISAVAAETRNMPQVSMSGGGSGGGRSTSGSGSSGGGGGFDTSKWFEKFKKNPKGAMSGMGKIGGGLAIAGLADSVIAGISLSDDLDKLYRSSGTAYRNFDAFIDKLPDLILSTNLSRKEIVALTESLQGMGVPVINTNKNLVDMENVLGRASKLMDLDAETVAHFGRNAYAADLSVSQLHDSMAKMWQTGGKLGLSFSQNKDAIKESVSSYEDLAAVLGKTQDQMTALTQKGKALIVSLGGRPEDTLQFMSGIGKNPFNQAIMRNMMGRAGFGLAPGEQGLSSGGMEKFFETFLYTMGTKSAGGRNIGLMSNRNEMQQQVMKQSFEQFASLGHQDVGFLERMYNQFQSYYLQNPDKLRQLMAGGPNGMHSAVQSYVQRQVGRMQSQGKYTKDFDTASADFSHTLGQVPKNMARAVEAAQTKLGTGPMKSLDDFQNDIYDVVSSGFTDVKKALDRLGGGKGATAGLQKLGGIAAETFGWAGNKIWANAQKKVPLLHMLGSGMSAESNFVKSFNFAGLGASTNPAIKALSQAGTKSPIVALLPPSHPAAKALAKTPHASASSSSGLIDIGGGMQLAPAAAKAYLADQAEAAKHGVVLHVNSAYRGDAAQKQLYDQLHGKQAVAGYYDKNHVFHNTSNHARGLAVDIQNHKEAAPYMVGFVQGDGHGSLLNDPYHFRYVGTQPTIQKSKSRITEIPKAPQTPMATIGPGARDWNQHSRAEDLMSYSPLAGERGSGLTASQVSDLKKEAGIRDPQMDELIELMKESLVSQQKLLTNQQKNFMVDQQAQVVNRKQADSTTKAARHGNA